MGKEIIQHFNMLTMSAYTCPKQCLLSCKGPVRLIKRVKVAHSSLQAVSYLFHFVILNLFMHSTYGCQKFFETHF